MPLVHFAEVFKAGRVPNTESDTRGLVAPSVPPRKGSSMSRRWKLIPCVLLTSVALVVPTQGAVSGAAASRPHAPAQSHGPAKAGKWVQLSSSPGVSILSEPNSLRLPTGGIQVVWSQVRRGERLDVESMS